MFYQTGNWFMQLQDWSWYTVKNAPFDILLKSGRYQLALCCDLEGRFIQHLPRYIQLFCEIQIKPSLQERPYKHELNQALFRDAFKRFDPRSETALSRKQDIEISQNFLHQVQIKNDIDQMLEHIMILTFWQQIMNLYYSLRILYNLYHSYCTIIEDFNIQQRQGYVSKLHI